MLAWKFRHLELFVADTARAKKFYVDVLGAQVDVEQADGKFVWLNLGGLEVLLRPGNGDHSTGAYNRAPAGMVLTTTDLESTKRELEARGLAFDGDDGAGCPTFRDPDGHWFQLIAE